MNKEILFLSCATWIAILAIYKWIVLNDSTLKIWNRYNEKWQKNSIFYKSPNLAKIPLLQIYASLLLFMISPFKPELLLLLFLILLLPDMAASQLMSRHKKLLSKQLDTMLSGLSNAMTVNGNLQYALEDVVTGEPEPMKTELKKVLNEVKLGQTIEDALSRFADRSGLMELQTAVSQIIIGKKTGGNLSKILDSTASGLREISRLEGVIQSKTSEGKGQAWVIGFTPPLLIVILQVTDPDWLLPMWTTPMGWALLGGCVILELSAILMIKKILAVDI